MYTQKSQQYETNNYIVVLENYVLIVLLWLFELNLFFFFFENRNINLQNAIRWMMVWSYQVRLLQFYKLFTLKTMI